MKTVEEIIKKYISVKKRREKLENIYKRKNRDYYEELEYHNGQLAAYRDVLDMTEFQIENYA